MILVNSFGEADILKGHDPMWNSCNKLYICYELSKAYQGEKKRKTKPKKKKKKKNPKQTKTNKQKKIWFS